MSIMISTTALKQARDHAAAAPLAALGRKRKKLEETGRPVLARVLAFLEEKVFEEGIEAAAVASAVGSTTASISPRIETHTGYSLTDLIARVRFETALHMKAAEPELGVKELSEALGLSEYRLRRLFEKWPDEAPSRKRCRQREFDPVRGASCDLAARGKLAVDEVEKVLAYLRSVCPTAFADAAAVAAPTAAFDSGPAPSISARNLAIPVEPAVAEQVWSQLSRLSYSAQREVVVQHGFASRAFFDLLVRKSREAGRRNPQQGVEIAELAVLNVRVSAALLGELAHQLLAEGLAWLGNARCLALNFFGAERDLKKALEVLDNHKELKGSLTDGIVNFIIGNLRLFEQEYDEASSRFDYALDVFERHESLFWQIQCLMQRAVAVVYVAGPAMAVPHFEKILPLVAEAGAEDLTFQVRCNLANCLSRAGRYEDATAELRRLKDGDSLLANPLWQWHVIATEGNVDQGLQRFSDAREKYVTASAGFESSGASLSVALVKLDLAILASETNRAEEVVEIVTTILPFFESLKLCTETVESLRLLAEALSRMCVTIELLSRLRDSLCRDPLVSLVD